MKILDTSPITDSSLLPIKKGTLDFLQQAYQEGLSATIQGLIGSSYDPSLIYILWGASLTTSVGLYTNTAGAVFFNGEIYLVDAVTSAFPMPDGINMVLVQTQYSVNADPVTFDISGAVHNVHNIRKMAYINNHVSNNPVLIPYSLYNSITGDLNTLNDGSGNIELNFDNNLFITASTAGDDVYNFVFNTKDQSGFLSARVGAKTVVSAHFTGGSSHANVSSVPVSGQIVIISGGFLNVVVAHGYHVFTITYLGNDGTNDMFKVDFL